jgi:hypothetical protein
MLALIDVEYPAVNGIVHVANVPARGQPPDPTTGLRRGAPRLPVQRHAVLDDEARCRDRGALTRAFRVGREGLEPPTPCASWTIWAVHDVLHLITQWHASTPGSHPFVLVGKASIVQVLPCGPMPSSRVLSGGNVATYAQMATLLATSIGRPLLASPQGIGNGAASLRLQTTNTSSGGYVADYGRGGGTADRSADLGGETGQRLGAGPPRLLGGVVGVRADSPPLTARRIHSDTVTPRRHPTA